MNLSDWIARRADFTPEKSALRFEGREISYAALDARVAGLAAGFAGLGIGRGDRLAWLSHNHPDMIAALFACARLGAMLVPLNWRLAPPEHRYILEDCGAAILVATHDFTAAVDSFRGDLPHLRPVALTDLDRLPGRVPAAAGGYDDPVLIVYTSGTTGRPKGAVLTQSALLWNAVNSAHLHDLTSADRILTTAPLFHVGGLNIQTLPALHAGATVILHARFDPAATLAAIAADRPSLTVLVPAQIAALIEHPQWPAADLSSLRAVVTGSSIVPRSLIAAVHDRGVPVVQVYGTTETAPIAAYLPIADAVRKIGSTGKPALHCALRIVDDSGAEVAAGQRGEILVRGPNVMTGYWNDPAVTAEALRDGWFHTGDIGHRDAHGYLFIDDRKRDLIVSGGENVYPAELEAVLDACPDIAEAVVVAAPHPRWGEVPVAVVALRAGSRLGAEAVKALFAGRLARFKHPHDVIFVPALPRNAMGKVQRFALRAMIAARNG